MQFNDFGVGFLFAVLLTFIIMSCVEFYDRRKESKKLREVFDRLKSHL